MRAIPEATFFILSFPISVSLSFPQSMIDWLVGREWKGLTRETQEGNGKEKEKSGPSHIASPLGRL